MISLKDDISLWSDNAEKAPDLDIVHNNLGVALLKAGRFPEAFVELTKALESRSICDVSGEIQDVCFIG